MNISGKGIKYVAENKKIKKEEEKDL